MLGHQIRKVRLFIELELRVNDVKRMSRNLTQDVPGGIDADDLGKVTDRAFRHQEGDFMAQWS